MQAVWQTRQILVALSLLLSFTESPQAAQVACTATSCKAAHAHGKVTHNASAQSVCLRQAVWEIVRTLWLTAALTLLVGFVVVPKSARESCALDIAQHLEAAGGALSATATNLLLSAPHPVTVPPSRYLSCPALKFHHQIVRF